MEKRFFKFLTFCFLIEISPAISQQTRFLGQISARPFKNYFRIMVGCSRDQVRVNYSPGKVQIETLNMELFEKLKSETRAIPVEGKYITNISTDDSQFPKVPAKIIFQLAGPEIEVFSYYRDNEKAFVLDFWEGETSPEGHLDKKISQVELEKAAVPAQEPAKARSADGQGKGPTPPVKKERAKEKKQVPPPHAAPVVHQEAPEALYRDFRYGAALVWDYPPLIPRPAKFINLERKAPDYFHPVEDRAYTKDEMEAHLQLNINLYREKKWGLMAKSIDLFHKKYGEESHFVLNEYLKANALLKSNLEKDNQGPIKAAIIKFANIAELTKEYPMKKGILQYLTEYMLKQNDYLQALQFAKMLFVASKSQFDEETAAYAAENILFDLVKLGQNEKIQEFLKETTIQNLLPAQMKESYRFYALLDKGLIEEVISEYEKNKDSYQRPLHYSILFNVGEAYFRNAQYEKAIKLFDEFLTQYSVEEYGSHAHLRIALAYDIQGREIKEIIELYKNAINKISVPEIRYEAKIRYVGIRLNRKIKLNDFDRETIVFLENTPVERAVIHPELKKTLWLVRLRSLINQKEYAKALSYLKTLPIKSMRPTERRIFEGDGAEIIYGLIKNAYEVGDFGMAVRLWEKYKDIYIDKVAASPNINFLICKSYLHLDLDKSFARSIEALKKMRKEYKKTFPVWVEEGPPSSMDFMTHELEMTKYFNLSEWEKALELNGQFMKENPGFKKGPFLEGIIRYKQKKFQEAIASFEKYFVEAPGEMDLNHKDTADLFQFYTESLYSTNQIDKFKKYADVVLEKTENVPVKSPFMKSLDERISYLLIEVLAAEEGSAEGAKGSLEIKIDSFLKNYPESAYKNRVNYLLGMVKIKSNTEEGVSILNKMIADKGVPDYLKELIRAELSFQKFKNGKI